MQKFPAIGCIVQEFTAKTRNKQKFTAEMMLNGVNVPKFTANARNMQKFTAEMM
jgi:hypothetical protein